MNAPKKEPKKRSFFKSIFKRKKERTDKLNQEDLEDNIREIELKLEKEFDANSLQTLINHYTVSMGTYEHKDPQRYKDYLCRMNNLLSQPEILMKMNELNKSSKLFNKL